MDNLKLHRIAAEAKAKKVVDSMIKGRAKKWKYNALAD